MGTAIGTKFAPANANLFMTRLEERLLNASPDKPLVWMRFIDDVFFIWTHGEEKLKFFINHLNSSHETIKFTSEQSRDRISFLDVQVRLGEGGILSTDSAIQLMHISTCIRSLVTLGTQRRRSPLVRLLGCVEYAPKVANFRRGWASRGYEESLVNEQMDSVRRLDRTTLLANSGNRTNDQGRGKGL